jgi:hypothetical protein
LGNFISRAPQHFEIFRSGESASNAAAVREITRVGGQFDSNIKPLKTSSPPARLPA